MKTVLLLCGGKSDEHEISLISAKCVLDAFDRTQYTPIVVSISRQGVWMLQEEKTFYTGELRADKIKLNDKGEHVMLAPFLTKEGRGRLEAGGRIVEFDIVFPLLHGQFGEDGTMQGLWDVVGVPYVGSGCGSSWICMDKVLTKTLLMDAGVRVAEYVWVSSVDELRAKAEEIKKLGEPIFVKPARQGSSVGVSKVKTLDALPAAVTEALKFDSKVLIEKGISGREIECAVLGTKKSAKASLPGEIVPSKKIGWYSYEAKYLLADGAETLAPAPLTPDQVKRVQEMALRVFKVLECDGMARIDMFLENGTGELYLNEANTIPGFTPISMYPKMWDVSGTPYPKLINELVALALKRTY